VLQTNTVNDADIGFPHDPSNAIRGGPSGLASTKE
jgi:hypothetical protein